MGRDGKHITAVLFDLDDTLIDHSKRKTDWDAHLRPMINRIHTRLAAEGFDVPNQRDTRAAFEKASRAAWQRARHTRKSVSLVSLIQSICDQFNVDLNKISIADLLDEFGWKPMPGVVPFDDAHEVLTTLREQGYKIGLITNSFQPMWMRDIEMREYDILKYIDARTTSGDFGFIKPHPSIFLHILSELNVAPENAVFVGDHPRFDVSGANAAGMTSVLMDPPHLSREIRGDRPDFVIQSLSQLLPILEELEGGIDL